MSVSSWHDDIYKEINPQNDQMDQSLRQEQTQTQQNLQQISQQQLLMVKLVEMPLVQFEESVKTELNENGALEENLPDDDYTTEDDFTNDTPENETFDQQNEREEREEQLNKALENIGIDDEMDSPAQMRAADDYVEPVFGNTESFYDLLKRQMGEQDLDERQQTIMEYLIGSLDEIGRLRTSIQDIRDDLDIYHYLDTTEEEIEEMVNLLQTFDPPGVGAKNLQECLLLQIDRKKDSPVKQQMTQLVKHHFNELKKNHWSRIQSAMRLDDEERAVLQKEIRKLNPKPGAALGEAVGKSQQQITPDFIVETSDDGQVTFTINHGNIPEMHIAPSYLETIDQYKNKPQLNQREKDYLTYSKDRVDRAKNFIEAIRQRRITLYKTMKAIIDIQLHFFREGDDADLCPMKLKDIADRTGLDISTVSRVCNQKYAQTRWGIFSLKYFFSDSYVTDNGEEMSTRRIKSALKRIIDEEDKKHPLSDEALTQKMKEAGFPISRRTVNKYRDQLNIPKASLRKS